MFSQNNIEDEKEEEAKKNLISPATTNAFISLGTLIRI